MTKTQSRARTRKAGNSKAPAAEPATPEMTRRRLLGRLGYGALGVAAFGGAGIWGTRHVQAINAEHDLSRVGQGVPTVVQIHDPQCPVCMALQKQTRKALRGIDEQDLLYLIASIRTAEGSAFAGRFGVPHVTLLLFDGQGELRQTLRGPQEAEHLRPIFESLGRRG
ncbi:hypothetical protein SAMN05443999_106216 [Roseovarius azorensis]|uniref:Thioredoxin n=1 Tax=Roseovarius azorensis TaxID=1287727 RepID=A0A1H7RLE4_9RHOB|nr:hypothetical protein [Roseovarius azorensis]SEL61023.1 hypothetical protein SAMN05443999_106216 [Roseovarius azorensis]